ncbi:hypothetical protein [Kribbella sp. NPDC004536]|uniref:hypothetical protein n=1 Tax=Kribbella sp. NPDC004536 TaxID=3364106 RepID=UPI003686858D
MDADLVRGQRALKRRRITGIASATVATALVIGVGWSVLPSGTTSGAPAATVTKKPIVGDPDKRKPPVIPATAVPLVANTKAFPGVITCDLIPKGWVVRIVYASPIAQQQDLSDPNLNPKKFHNATYTLTVRQTELMDEGEGLTVDKYSTPWTKLPKVRAGKYQAVASGVPGSPNGRQEVYIKPGKSNKIVGVSNHAYNLAWDMDTLLRFAGSCHYK